MINTVGITGLYTALTEAISTKLDALYTADKIDAETYAKILAQSFDEALKLSVSAIQQQEQIEKDAALKEAQTSLIGYQIDNLVLEGINISKQAELIKAQTLVQENQALEVVSKTELINQQKLNLTSEALNIPKQGLKIDSEKALIDQQKANLVSENLKIGAQTALITQQKENALVENTVLTAQKCKLDAEYEYTLKTTLKTASETSLLDQKKVTEQAQTAAGTADPDSVIGKQKALYAAQTTGYENDAKQKAGDLYVKAWATAKTTDPTTHDLTTIITKLNGLLGM